MGLCVYVIRHNGEKGVLLLLSDTPYAWSNLHTYAL